jgi:hypothetical protein
LVAALDSSIREPAGPTTHRESPMQQWLNLAHTAGDLITFAVALINLTTAIINRRNPSNGQTTSSTGS